MSKWSEKFADFKPDPSFARKLGLGKIVDEIVDTARRVKAPIYWNKESHLFGACVKDMHVQDKDAEVVKTWVEARLKAITEITWTPVIIVRDIADHTSRWYGDKEILTNCVNFSFERFYAAMLPDGAVRTVIWEALPEDRLDKYASFHEWPLDSKKKTLSDLPFVDSHNYFFPYSEEFWLGILSIQQGINALRMRLQQLLNRNDAAKVIGDAGARIMQQLTAPQAPQIGQSRRAELEAYGDVFLTMSEAEARAFPGGHPTYEAYAWAEMAAIKFDGSRVGFTWKGNPASQLPRGDHGHDFALIDNQYIVDYYSKYVTKAIDRSVFDLLDPIDLVLIDKYYGNRNKWQFVKRS